MILLDLLILFLTIINFQVKLFNILLFDMQVIGKFSL